MVAVAYTISDPWVVARPAGTTRPSHPDHPPVGPASTARLVWQRQPRTHSHRPGAGVYRRRRVVALAALVAVAVLMVAGARVALAGPGGGALTTSGSAGAPIEPQAGHTYVVRPGDSLWSIVEAATRHHGDPRPEVDRLADELHGKALQPGQHLQIP